MSGKAKKSKGINMAKEILYSGKAFKKFKEIIHAQEGKIHLGGLAKNKKNFYAKKSGKISEIHNKKINSLARIAGCPVDKKAGIYINRKLGDYVKKGDLLMTVYSESEQRLNHSIKYYEVELPILIKN